MLRVGSIVEAAFICALIPPRIFPILAGPSKG